MKKLVVIFILIHLLSNLISAQNWENHVKTKTLGQYYQSQLKGKVFEEPWLIYSQYGFKNPLTDRIDKVHYPAHLPWINTAWTVMQMKTGIIPEKNIKKVSGALLEFWENPESKYHDLYGLQSFVSERHGIEVGGDLMIARTRPPMRQQFAVRHELMKMICLMHDFQQVLLETASKHTKTVLPGYTHIRHAQPTTLGHYLMSVYDPIDRSMKIVEDGYKAMSLNELGCGALAGTSWPVDRELVSRYLGLEGLLENTNDAVSYTDGYVLLLAGLTNIVTVISRMGLEMEFWSGLEYDFMDFEIGAGSYMMPNKRGNQTYLENPAVAVAQMLGNLNEVASMGIRIPHGDMQPMAYNMQSATTNAIGVINKHINPFLYHFPGMKVHAEKMLETARKGYSCASELANEIGRRFGIDYRTSHDIVHVFVLLSSEKSIPSENADIREFQKAAQKVVGRKLNISEKELRTILDPVHFVEVTNSQGGVSPSEVMRMINDRWQKLEQARQRHIDRIIKLEEGKSRMMSDLRDLFKH
jgi:argininosuccinate lyase